MGRIDVIDGMRGYFLVFMMVNHISFAATPLIKYLNHRYVFYMEDAQGFVFLSGLMAGIVYTRYAQKNGFQSSRNKLWARAFDIYKYYIVIGAGLFIAASAPFFYDAFKAWMSPLSVSSPGSWAVLALMLKQVPYGDVLVQYVVYMSVAPFAILAVMKGRWVWVAAISFSLWLSTQVGFGGATSSVLNGLAAVLDPGVRLAGSFHVFAWQFVFFTGLIFGALASSKAVDWSKVFPQDGGLFLPVSLLVVGLFLIVRLLTEANPLTHLLPDSAVARFEAQRVRSVFSLVYLADFAAVAYLAAWLLVRGRESTVAAARWAEWGLRWVFSLPYLRMLGRHSLQVYAFHMVLVYVVAWLDTIYRFNQVGMTLLLFGCIGALGVVPYLRERAKAQAKARAVQAQGAKADSVA